MVNAQGEAFFENVARGTYELVAGSPNIAYAIVRSTSQDHENAGQIITWLNNTAGLRLVISTIIAVFLGLALGCGGNNTPPVRAPSNLVYPQPTVTAEVGKAITTDIPTVTGTVDSYTVSPTLPPGLSLSSSTGVISGTPTAVAAQVNYTVTAMNSAGSTTAMVQILVNAAVVAPSNLVYPQPTVTAEVGKVITTDIPTVTGTVDSYTVSPNLPPGLSLSSSTGVISGTPTAVAALATYVVTASNSGGNATASITITVNTAPRVLFELGHAAEVTFLRFDNSRVLSQDSNQHWVLWDYASGAILANGDQYSPLPLDMGGNTVVIGLPNGLEVRSSSDGHILSTIVSSASWWKLATDGSYICAGSRAGLSVWTPTGRILVSRPGDYSAAKIFAAPGEVRVALGPAGQNVVETISTASGTSSVTPAFSGQFNSWFLDGQRFLTNQSNTVWTYSKSGIQQAIVALPTIANLSGEGGWLWVQSDLGLDIYSVGSNSPSLTVTSGAEVISGMTIGVLRIGTSAIGVIDLSGSSLSEVDYALPIAYTSAYAATSSSQWLVGNVHGVVLDGASIANTPRYFGMGAAWSIAGGVARAAVATATGTIVYLDPSGTTAEGSISFSSSKLEFSSDGTVLAAAANTNDSQYEVDRTLKVFSLPGATQINSWPYTFQYQTPFLFDFSLSGSGALLGQVLESESGLSFTRQVTATTGGPTIWSDSLSSDPIRISPDGTLIAVSSGLFSGTNIYRNGILTTAVPGWAVGWIDDDRLLVNNYAAGSAPVFSGCTIYDPTGIKLAAPALPELQEFQAVTSDWVYSARENAIFSLTTGASTWTSADPSVGVGAVSGSFVVFESGSRVLAESY